MKNETLYNKTVDILVQAYFNDTLQHGNQCACAVGNLVAANCGIELGVINPTAASNIGPIEFKGYSAHNFPHTKINNGLWYNHPDMAIAQEQIKATGYTMNEILLIEKAFEGVNKFSGKEQRMFDGLTAVIETLGQIHENIDTAVTKNSKKRFNKLSISN